MESEIDSRRSSIRNNSNSIASYVETESQMEEIETSKDNSLGKAFNRQSQLFGKWALHSGSMEILAVHKF